MPQTINIDVSDWIGESIREFIKWLIAMDFNVTYEGVMLIAIKIE